MDGWPGSWVDMGQIAGGKLIWPKYIVQNFEELTVIKNYKDFRVF